MDVVAFVRDVKKLEKVLYDDQDLVMDNLVESASGKKGKSGPRLQVVVSDAVSRRDVYQQSFETEDEERVLDVWVDKVQHYFAGRGWKNNNSTGDFKSLENDTKVNNDVDILESGGEEALRDAVSGATILISCLGSFRPSNFWTDYVRVPILRVFRRDVTKWCSDARHPYYVNYLTTKKILDEAEREQKRRSAMLEFEKERLTREETLKQGREKSGGTGMEEEGFESEIAARLTRLRRKRNEVGLSKSQNNNNYNSNGEDAIRLPKKGKLPSSSDRIKFIRISHLMVGHSPFRLWNVLTNIFWSQLSKFELMGEMLMEASTLVDTIVLRPGDLTDDKRNANHTSLQLCIDGTVESPSMVGREDVADLAVVAALTKTSLNNTSQGVNDAKNETESKIANAPHKQSSAHHYTWAMRWTGQHLSPPQGLRPDGLPSAALCFVKALKEQTKIDRHERLKEHKLKSYYGGKELVRLTRLMRRGRLKLYSQSLAISIPVYAAMGLLSWYLFGQAFINLFLRLKQLNVPQIIIKLLPS